MRTSLRVIVCLMTVGLSLSVTEIKRGPTNNCGNKPVYQTAYIESSVTINCTYPRTDENTIKRLCKEDDNFDCKDLVSTHTANLTIRERFSLTHYKHQGVFTVSISTLTQKDAGRYKCVLKRLNNDSFQCYTEIHLSVLTERHIKTTKLGLPVLQAATAQPPTTHHDAPDLGAHMNLNAVVIVGVTCLVFLVMTLVVLILYRHKLPWRHGGSSEQSTSTGNNAEGNYGDHNYKETQMRNQQASSGDALPSIYAMVSPHTDTLHYACVTFQKDSVSVSADGNRLPNTNTTGSSACDYSYRAQGGMCPPAEEQPLYSTVTNPR